MLKAKNFNIYFFFSFFSGLGVRMFFLFVLSITLMVLDYKYSSFSYLRKFTSFFATSVYYAVDRPIEGVDQFFSQLKTYRQLKKENEELKSKQILLSARLQRLSALEFENKKLQALFESTQHFENKVLVANLLSIDASPFSQQVILNKGQKQGVFVGQPVLDENGVMGQVIEVLPFTSRTILITDKQSAVPVQVNRNGLRAVAIGSGNSGYLSLLHVTDRADIKEGDLIVTSGLGKHFPFGYPVGKVISINKSSNAYFIEVFVEPSAGLERSRQVLLLWPETKILEKKGREHE